ncbi:MAG: hypothetical protein IPL16_05360 [Ignavibacteria bacterium]|nr:hypothetical protein [Ignavibacteria bacterium]
MTNESLASEVESLKEMNEKIIKLEKMVNEITSGKQTSLKSKTTNLSNSK